MTFYFQSNSNNYYLTWNNLNVLSQSSTGGTTYQQFDLDTDSTQICLGNPKDSAKTIYTYLKGSNSGPAGFQSPYFDTYSIWQQISESGGTTAFYSLVYGKYLGVSGTSLALVNTITSACKWTKTYIPSNAGYYSISINPSGTTYYLRADVDGHSVVLSTSLNTSDQSYWWQVSSDVCGYIAETYTSNYIISNGDGTVSITSSPTNACYWVLISRNSSNSVYCFQSIYGGYLAANGDNSTISEYMVSPVPAPGALPSKTQWTATNVFLKEKQPSDALERSVSNSFTEKLKKLQEAGFSDNDENIKALVENNADIIKAIEYLESRR